MHTDSFDLYSGFSLATKVQRPDHRMWRLSFCFELPCFLCNCLLKFVLNRLRLSPTNSVGQNQILGVIPLTAQNVVIILAAERQNLVTALSFLLHTIRCRWSWTSCATPSRG